MKYSAQRKEQEGRRDESVENSDDEMELPGASKNS
jgi:hypothetical protein